MKMRILIILSVLFLSSCGAKRNTTTKRKIVKNRTVVNSKRVKPIKKSKNAVSKPVKTIVSQKDKIQNSEPLTVDISKNKTVFDKGLLDVIYANKPHLLIAKIDYIKQYAALAIHEMETYKIPASITLAQGLLESRYGQSRLTVDAKNHFGIKCHKWQGQRIYHDDDEKGECFRKYELDEASFRDHSLFLAHKKRYAKLFTYAQNDFTSWAYGLRKAGYATDKKYPQKLIKLINEYELYYFDKLVLGDSYQFKEITPIKNLKPTIQSNQISNQPINNDKLKHYIVKSGDTLFSISRKTGKSVEQIKTLNKLITNKLAIGQRLQILNNNVNTNLNLALKHIVKTGDTIYSIARMYNIAVSNLIKINNLSSKTITIGQILIVK